MFEKELNSRWEVEKLMLQETINITLFITTTIAMFGIMRTLFNLSEINFKLIKQTLLKISDLLFRENYNEHAPKMNNGGFQIISMNLETNFSESPA
ncbi:MAG: hypothetical protein ACI9WV_000208 [Patiriisocius sp.]